MGCKFYGGFNKVVSERMILWHNGGLPVAVSGEMGTCFELRSGGFSTLQVLCPVALSQAFALNLLRPFAACIVLQSKQLHTATGHESAL